MKKVNYESEKIELYFSCRNLPNFDTFSKTDAKVILYIKNGSYWNKINETEVVWDNLNPDFATTIIVDYFFEIQQYFKVEVVDIDDKNDHSNFEFIGFHEFELGKIIGNNKAYYNDLKDKNSKNRGFIIIRYDKVSKMKKIYNFDINCNKIKDIRSFFSKSNPFLRFYKYIGNSQIDVNYDSIAQNQWLLTYQTEHQKKNLNPIFKNIKISSSKFCSTDINLPLKIEVWDYHTNGSHKLIGYEYFRMNNLLSENKILTLIDKGNNKKKAGTIKFDKLTEEDDYDIIDYIRSGLQIQTCIAIDFTASNMDPTDPNSLHCYNPNYQNLYEKAIYGTTNVLLNYDHDQEIPVFGFGFKFQGNPEMQTMYPLSFDWNNTTAKGLNQVMNYYKNALNNIIFSGPTFFAPIIKIISDIIKNSMINKQNEYFILTLLTDGVNHDMNETIDSIVEASDLPLSIIIIGIGNADFTNMEILDGDDITLVSSKGIKTKRDIVQFVPFNKFGNNQIELTREILYEIPNQIKEYFKLKNIIPNNNLYKHTASLKY